tara:strand:+ start:587 stop:1117 length:531 start_codon:yes stop_codon:yes gene_type:complete
MEMCAYCGTPMLGGRCTNLNCRIANEKRNNKRATISKNIENNKKAPVKKPRKKSFKAAYMEYIQPNGDILVPVNIHLEFQDSLPKFMGYKSDKNSDNKMRRNALEALFCNNFVVHKNAENRFSIGEFGKPESKKRLTKIISWFDGRIAKSQRPNLASSLKKLKDDRKFVIDNFDVK